MTENRYPLATSTWDDAEYEALQSVISSGRFTMGPKVREFEEAFADYFGSTYAVMVNSGSSANLAAFTAAVSNPELNLQPGDEVIVPAVSWATTYYPANQVGLSLVFVDIDLDTLNIDVDKAIAAVTPRTKAIFAVNLLGNPADLIRLRTFCDESGILLLEDNCESLGASIDGKFTGTFGLAGTFSSFFSHHISTMEGGLITTDDRYMYEAMTSIRAHGWTRELPVDNLVHPKSGDEFDDLFRFVLPGYNLRPLEMSGALGLTQLEKVPALIRGRQENGRIFQEMFSDVSSIRTQKINGSSSWFGFSLVLEERLSGRRADVVKALKSAGIESRPIVAGNFTKNPVMSRLNARIDGELPAADKVHVDGLFVGNHHYPIPSELALLAECLESIA